MRFPAKYGFNCLQSSLFVLCPLALSMQVAAEVETIETAEARTATVTTMEEGNPDDSTVTYPASYFNQYDPVSAFDMLNRIPGIDRALNSGGGGGDRGLGAGSSSILIDGKRIPGKQNSGRDVLGRIAANQVDYIEIIRGSSAELDVRTDGPIVNVVMLEGAGRSSVSVEANADYYQKDGEVQPGGSVSVGGQRGALNYLASFAAEPRYEHEVREEESFTGDGSPNQTIVESRVRDQTTYTFSSNVGYQFDDRNLLQLNALYEDSSPPRDLDRVTTDLATDPGQVFLQREEREAERHKWEFGGTYQHSFADSSRFNFIFIVNDDTDNYAYDRVDVDVDTESKVLYVAEDKRYRERIGRGSYTTSLNATQDLEVGVEVAQTLLDKTFLLGTNSAGVALPRFGGLVAGTDTQSSVEEMRYEPFAIHNWQLGESSTLETTLVMEMSEITQQGLENGRAVAKQREFEFLKPKLDYRYDINPATQLRTTIERDISQLSFGDFSASNDGDLESNVQAGNPNLEQEKSWRYEVNLEYRLPDDVGVLNSRVFYHDIEDVIDRVDVSPDSSVLLSAPGNIGDGKRYGARLDASLRLNALDMPDALVTFAALVQDSEVMDPFLNEERRISRHGRGFTKIGYRHDLPAWGINYGFDYHYNLRGGYKTVDIDDILEFERDPGTSLFLEKVAFGGVTFRFEAFNLIDGERCFKRTRFDGATADGIVEEVEKYCYSTGPKMALKIRTTF